MNKAWIAAGVLNLITALVHTIVGGNELFIPFESLEFEVSLKAMLHACWHMVTVMLFFSSIAFLYFGIKPRRYASGQISVLLGMTYFAFTIVFVVISVAYGLFLSQPAFLLPIGALAIFGAMGKQS